MRSIHTGLRLVFVRRARMNRYDAAIGVAAEAHDFHFASHALAVVATIFLLFGGNAGTGHIRAFFWTKHSPPLPFHPLQPQLRDWRQDFGADAEIVAQLAHTYEENRKIFSESGRKPSEWAETRCFRSSAAASD
jgi:hypothetical protein